MERKGWGYVEEERVSVSLISLHMQSWTLRLFKMSLTCNEKNIS